jgi:hypothetical protein
LTRSEVTRNNGLIAYGLCMISEHSSSKSYFYFVKKHKTGIKKDWLIIAFVHSRVFILSLLAILLLFVFQDDRVLITNPKKPRMLEWAIGLAIFLLFMGFRMWKYPAYYKSMFNDIVSAVASIVFTAFYTFFIVTIIQIPVLMHIRRTARDSPQQKFDCEVVNVITLGIDKVYFKFKGQKHTRYFDLNGKSAEDAEDLFRLRVTVRKADFDCYVLDAMELVPKNEVGALSAR